MVVRVRLHAALAADGREAATLDLPESARVADALRALGLSGSDEAVVLLDGGPAWPDTSLSHGCELEVLPLADGG